MSLKERTFTQQQRIINQFEKIVKVYSANRIWNQPALNIYLHLEALETSISHCH